MLKISKFNFFSMISILGVSFLSAYKSITFFPDAEIYESYYNSIISNNFVIVEPTYKIISVFSDAINVNFSGVLFVYAFLSVSIKFIAIKKIEKPFLYVLLYSFSYLVLHEFIQIRIAVAISFLILGYQLYFDERKTLALLVFTIAPFFHMASIVFPVVFYVSLCCERSNIFVSILPVIIIALIFFSLSGYLSPDIFSKIVPFTLGLKLQQYIERQDVVVQEINFFSIRLILFYIIVLSYMPRIKFIDLKDRILVILLSFFLTLMFLLSFLPTISLRVIEIAGPFFIFIIISMYDYFYRWYVNLILFIFSLSSVYYSYILLF